MIICQSIRGVLDRHHASAQGYSHVRSLFAVVLMTVLVSLSVISPTMARGGDNDDDGLTNGDENKYGTNRTVADTDGDGLLDGAEVYTYFTGPTDSDTDHDRAGDGSEVALGMNPLDADTDDDLLNDDVEVRVYFTSPQHRNSDSDSLTDYTEVMILGTNPLRWDTDGDYVPDNFDRFPLDPLRQNF